MNQEFTQNTGDRKPIIPRETFRDTLIQLALKQGVNADSFIRLITFDNAQDILAILEDSIAPAEKERFFRSTSNTRDIIYNSPLLENARKQDRLETLQMKAPVDVVKSEYKCRNCGSDRTYTTEKQTRSLDEGGTVKVHCTNCQASF